MGVLLSKPVQVRFILLVEDNEDDVTLTRRALQKVDETVSLVVAKDGQEGLDACEELDRKAEGAVYHEPLFILLDLKLPKASGLEVFRCFREHDRTSGIPIILISSSKEEIALLAREGLGADDYLFKPITTDDLNKFLKLYA